MKKEQALLRRVASVVGHELRNPLAVINNSAYFVRAKLGSAAIDPKVEKHLKIIASEIARADQLISDILSYSRPVEPKAETLALDSIVGGAVKAYVPGGGGKLEFRPGAKGASVKADSAFLADALRRLVDNAFDAVGGGGTVIVSTGTGKGGAWFEVADKGPGVDKKIHNDLFGPFVTTKPRGLGLSLALIRKQAEAQGGSVAYLGGSTGAVFRLALPKA